MTATARHKQSHTRETAMSQAHKYFWQCQKCARDDWPFKGLRPKPSSVDRDWEGTMPLPGYAKTGCSAGRIAAKQGSQA